MSTSVVVVVVVVEMVVVEVKHRSSTSDIRYRSGAVKRFQFSAGRREGT